MFTLMMPVFLLAGYLKLATGVFSGGLDFDLSLDFRTDQLNALLLFSYNTKTEDYLLVRAVTRLKQLFKDYKYL